MSSCGTRTSQKPKVCGVDGKAPSPQRRICRPQQVRTVAAGPSATLIRNKLRAVGGEAALGVRSPGTGRGTGRALLTRPQKPRVRSEPLKGKEEPAPGRAGCGCCELPTVVVLGAASREG